MTRPLALKINYATYICLYVYECTNMSVTLTVLLQPPVQKEVCGAVALSLSLPKAYGP